MSLHKRVLDRLLQLASEGYEVTLGPDPIGTGAPDGSVHVKISLADFHGQWLLPGRDRAIAPHDLTMILDRFEDEVAEHLERSLRGQ